MNDSALFSKMHANGTPYVKPLLTLSGDKKSPKNVQVQAKDLKKDDLLKGVAVSMVKVGANRTDVKMSDGAELTFNNYLKLTVTR